MEFKLKLKKISVVIFSFSAVVLVLMLFAKIAGFALYEEPTRAVTWQEQQQHLYSPVYSKQHHMLYAIDFVREGSLKAIERE